MDRHQVLAVGRFSYAELVAENAAANFRHKRCLAQLRLYEQDLDRLQNELQHQAASVEDRVPAEARAVYDELLSQKAAAEFRIKRCLIQLQLYEQGMSRALEGLERGKSGLAALEEYARSSRNCTSFTSRMNHLVVIAQCGAED
jgi:hypothetical protein